LNLSGRNSSSFAKWSRKPAWVEGVRKSVDLLKVVAPKEVSDFAPQAI
jgi:hypothetical protein